MKNIIFIVIGLMCFSQLHAQHLIKVTLSGSISGTSSEDVRLSQRIKGDEYQDFATSKLGKNGVFSITAELPRSDYYVLRVNEGNIHLILRDTSNIKVYCDAKDIGKFTNFINSDESAELNRFSHESEKWLHDRQVAMKAMKQQPENRAKYEAEMQKSLKEFQGVFRSFFQKNQKSPALIATLNLLNPEQDFETYERIVNELKISFPQSTKVQELSKKYQVVKAKVEANNPFAPGKIAPDFEELMLDRESKLKLSDLRGQVVLLDFWASWCGPCRRENPNVVKVYNDYKDKGFTVLSVSLDKSLSKWKEAIEHDKLTWPNHVSDLKGWSSAVGRIYHVNSIPFAVLIDKEGKIVDVNLRGDALRVAVSQLLD